MNYFNQSTPVMTVANFCDALKAAGGETDLTRALDRVLKVASLIEYVDRIFGTGQERLAATRLEIHKIIGEEK